MGFNSAFKVLSKGRIVVNYGDFIRVTKQGIYIIIITIITFMKG